MADAGIQHEGRADEPASAPVRAGHKIGFSLFGGPRAVVAGIGLTLLGVLVWFSLFALPLPVSIVAPRIVQAVEERLGPGYSVGITAASIDRGTDGLELRMDGFEVRDPGGTPVLRVPSAVIGLDGDFVLGRRAGARAVRLIDPRLVVRVEGDGEVSFASEGGGAPLFRLPVGGLPEGAPGEMFGFFAAAEAVIRPDGPLASLERVEVQGGAIVIEDRRRGRVDALDRMNLRIARSGDGLAAGAFSLDPRNRWSISATMGAREGGGRDIDIGFENLPLARLLFEAAGPGAAAFTDGILAGHLYGRIEHDGAFSAAEARIEGRGVSLASPERPDTAVVIDRMRLNLAWDAAARMLRLRSSDLASGTGRVLLAGEAALDPSGERWQVHLRGSEIMLAGRDASVPPLPLDGAEASGTFEVAARQLRLDSFSVRSPIVSVAGSGSIRFGPGPPEVDFALASGAAPMAALLRLWPVPIAPMTRRWVDEHVVRGGVDSLSVAVKGPIGAGTREEDRAVSVDLAYRGGVVRPLPDLPPVSELRGTVRVRDGALDASFGGGLAEAASGGRLRLVEGHFQAENTRPDPFPATLTLHLAGPTAAAGALLQAPSLQAAAPPGIDLRSVGGDVDARIRLQGDFGEGAERADLVTTGSAQFTGAQLDNALGTARLEAGNLHLALDEGTASLRGDLRLAGATIALEARAARVQGGFGDATIALTGDPSKARIALGDLRIQGPVAARLSLPQLGSAEGLQVEADLTAAAVSAPFGISKPAGRAGRTSFGLESTGQRWLLRNFSSEARDLNLKGTIELDRSGALAAARFTTFKLSGGDDTRLDVDRTPQNLLRLTLRGSSFDSRALLRDMLAGSSAGKGTDLDLEAKLGTVLGHNGETVTGLDLKLQRRAGTLRALSLAGRAGQGRLDGGYADATHAIVIRGGDAGALLRFFDIYRRVRGGELGLELVHGTPNRGVLTLRDFAVVDEGAIAAAMARGGGREGVPEAGGARFSRMRAVFRQAEGRVSVEDSAIWGPDVGASLEGGIDFAAGRIDLRGTFVPAYAVNNLFSRLPLIGAILGGGSNEGLFGVTFQVTGPTANPTLRFNPISAVAPGFLRKLFEFRDAPAADEPAPRASARPAPPAGVPMPVPRPF